jgi:hypothetical protein
MLYIYKGCSLHNAILSTHRLRHSRPCKANHVSSYSPLKTTLQHWFRIEQKTRTIYRTSWYVNALTLLPLKTEIDRQSRNVTNHQSMLRNITEEWRSHLGPIHTYHAFPLPFSDANSHIPCRDPAVALRGRFQNGISVAWQGNGMACVNQTRPHCVNQRGKTQSKPSAERHGRGTAWYVWIKYSSTA